MSTQSLALCSVAMIMLSSVYLVLCPFTKVEESFNIQAVHDHVHFNFNVSEYDHQEFPGAVPRTFVGSLVVGLLSKPIIVLTSFVSSDKFVEQYIVRIILSLLVLLAFYDLLQAVKKLYGINVAIWTVLITSSQFHFLFYVSRPLPNTFAVIFVLLAFSSWLRNRHRDFVFYSGWTIIIFRCELAILFGLMLLLSVIFTNLSFLNLIKWVITTALISLGITLLVDSYFWQKLAWPELEAFHFNAVLNKSSEWGTSPFLWYFYSALPRATGLSLLLVPMSMLIDKRCLMICAPCLGYVLVYSILPHKELRFVLYVVPIFNIAAARICSMLWINRSKGFSRRVASLAVVGHIFCNILMTTFLLKLSYQNYPGGAAMAILHKKVDSSRNVSVHIDVYTAQTGVSKFLHLHDLWRYDKTEDFELFGREMMSFSHLLVGTPDEGDISKKIGGYQKTHNVLHSEKCFRQIAFLGFQEFPFFDVITKPCVWLLERK